MKNKERLSVLLTLIFLLVLMSSLVQAEVVVVANNSVNTDNLGLKDIKKIFLGKKMYWDDNQKITLFILKDSPAHKEFVRTYLGKSENQYTNYWKQLLFTGKGMMPQRVSQEELLEKIKETEGAIGYMAAGITTEGIRIIKIK